MKVGLRSSSTIPEHTFSCCRSALSTSRFAEVMMMCLLWTGWLVGCNGGSTSPPPPPPNPSPSLANGSLNPSSIVEGGVAFTVTVTGSNFVTSSAVQWNGSPRTTTYVSNTTLKATINAEDIAAAGMAMVTVSTPAPGGGTSSGLTFTVDNPAPTVTSINPTSAVVESGSFTLGVAGTNFLPSSTVQWNGSARATTFFSSTSLQATIAAADLAASGMVMVTVTNPAPGGGTSSSTAFAVDNPVPQLSFISPTTALAGSGDFILTATGANFVPSSVIQWNGNARNTTLVSSAQLQATITAADLAASGVVQVTVSNPAPGGGTSQNVHFGIINPAPAVSQLSPSSAVVGGTAFTLTVSGANFIPSSVVEWNGYGRPTTYISSAELQAAIPASDLAGIGIINVRVANPFAYGGNSAPVTFPIGSAGGSNFTAITINQSAQDIVYDPVNSVFYLSVTGTAASNPNTIAVLDPATGTITSTAPAGNNPNVLAISDDSQFLYAGIDGSASVQRFILPGLAKDISYSLGSDSFFGPYFALDLQVAPGAPHTTAVTLGNAGISPEATGGIRIFDDAVAMPNVASGADPGNKGDTYDSLQWGASATALYAANNEGGGDFYALTVSSSGVALSQDYPSVFGGFRERIHFDRGTNLFYSDEGHVVNPSTGLPIGNFNASGLVAPDSTLNTAFLAVGPFNSSSVDIESFDLTHFTPIGLITIPNVTGTPIRLIRWGNNGLAFNTTGGQIVLVMGAFVGQAPPFNVTPPPTPTLPPTPAPNAPTISQLTPSSAVAGGTGFTINISGTNFVASSVVQWNGSPRTTTFVSSTQLQAAITAADISSPGTANLTISNPAGNGGLSAGSNFLIGATGGTSSIGTGFAVNMVNLSSNDIAFDPKNQVFYLSVPQTVTNGNTISVLDPTNLQIVGNQVAGSNPHLLSISDDSQFLYVGMDGSFSVQRFTLPNLGIDVNYSLGTAGALGPQSALDLAVAPGAPHTSAIALGSFGNPPYGQGSVKIYDDATPRAVGGSVIDANNLCWGTDASTLFSTGGSSSDLFVFSVGPTSVTISHDYAAAIGDTRLHFDAGTKLVYSDTGHAVDPSTGNAIGTFTVSGLIVPDSTLNTAFFIVGPLGSSTLTIESFNLTTFSPISTITIPNVIGTPQRLVRWGQNGLAFNTDGGQMFLIGGNFVH
jgi:hypothetical protein